MRQALWGCVVLVAVAGCAPGPDREHVEALFELDARRLPPAAATAEQVERGRNLFTEHCQRCHRLDRHGQDGVPTATATGTNLPARNVPTVFDSARQVLFGWDGLVGDLPTMVQRELRTRCGRSDEPALADDAQAIAGYLATWRSVGRWDRYVEGDDAALSSAEQHGLAVFLTTGCAACHGGRNLGGATVHKLGLAQPWPTSDRGRAAVTGRAADEFLFKAPMLRRVAHTAPYLHDGSIATLPEMVRRMAKHELGKELAEAEVGAVVEFLGAVGDLDDTGR